MKIIVIILILFISQSCKTQSWEQMGNDIVGELSLDRIGKNMKLNAKGDRIVIGHSHNRVKIFGFTSGNWKQVGNTLVSNNRLFGKIVDINEIGNVVGITEDLKGNISIYKFINKKWNNISQVSENTRKYHLLEETNAYKIINSLQINSTNLIKTQSINLIRKNLSVSSIGKKIVFSYRELDNEFYKQIQVYKLNNDKWGKSNSLKIECPKYHVLNISISGNGEFIVLGFPDNKNSKEVKTGKVSVYQLKNDSFTQVGKDIFGEKKYDYFGNEISINEKGNIIAISTLNQTGGYTKVYKFNNNKWFQIGQKIEGFLAELNNSGNIIAVGNYKSNREKGIIKIYEYK